jgi:hypothetical protein
MYVGNAVCWGSLLHVDEIEYEREITCVITDHTHKYIE